MIAALFVVGEGAVADRCHRLGRSTAPQGGAWLKDSSAGRRHGRYGSPLRVSSVTPARSRLWLPAVVAAAWTVGSAPSKFLLPLAFAANTGGLLTLTGTPPNIVVAQTARAVRATSFQLLRVRPDRCAPAGRGRRLYGSRRPEDIAVPSCGSAAGRRRRRLSRARLRIFTWGESVPPPSAVKFQPRWEDGGGGQRSARPMTRRSSGSKGVNWHPTWSCSGTTSSLCVLRTR